MTKTDLDTKRENPWESEESKWEDVVVIDNERNEASHAILPLIQRKKKKVVITLDFGE